MNRENLPAYIVYLLFGATLFVIGLMMPWIGDDTFYQFNLVTGERIDSIGDILESQLRHYKVLNGRFLAHCILQAVLAFWWKWAYALVNAIFNVYFIIILLKVCQCNWRGWRTAFSAVALLLMIEVNFFDACTQVGYIWMGSLIFTYLYIFLYKAETPALGRPWALVLLFIFSLAAGNAHETLNIGIGFALIVYALRRLRSLSVPRWTMIAGFGIGGLLLCLAPGSLNRAESSVTPLYVSVITFVAQTRLMYVLIITLAVLKLRGRIELKRFLSENAFFVWIFLALLAFNFLIGTSNSRQTFGLEIMSAVLTLRALPAGAFPRWLLWVAVAVLVPMYAYQFRLVYNTARVTDEYMEKIKASDGNVYIDFPRNRAYGYNNYLLYATQHLQWKINDRCSANPVIRTYPDTFERIQKEPAENRVLECAPGCFMLMQDKKNPGTFILHRVIGPEWMDIHLPPYTVRFDEDGEFNTSDYNILYLPSEIPFVTNTDIQIIIND